MRFRPPQDWMPLGRPIGEWIFCAALLLAAWSQLASVRDAHPVSVAQGIAVVAMTLVGLSEAGIVLSIVLGLRIGVPLVWLFAFSTTAAAGLVTSTFVGAPVVDVVLSIFLSALVAGFVVWYGRRRVYGAVTRRQWPQLLAEHAAVVESFTNDLQRIPTDFWTRRAAPDGWSPAEITDHLARTYSQYAGESRGKNSLRNRLGPARRVFARTFIRPGLLKGAPFPKARAPRELRPAELTATPADGEALFRATGDACLRDLSIVVERRPYRTLVHPFLGALPLYESMRFATQHITHHQRQLQRVLAQLAASEQTNDLAS